MISDAAPIAFRSDSPELVERGTDTVLRLRPARAGAAITPDSATVTIYDASGTAVVSAAPATCADGMARYTVLGATTSALALSPSWTVAWSVVLPGETVARAVRTEAALVRSRLYPVISDQDIYRRVPALDPSGRAPISSETDYSSFLDDAWATIQERLLAKGDRPWLVLSPAALREPHLTLTLARVFDALATRLQPAFEAQAAIYRDQFQDAWNQLRFVYDRSETGTAGPEAGERKSVGGPVWLGGVMR